MRSWELREHRRRRGLTLAAVARAAGTSESNVSAYERGTKVPNERTRARLSAVVEAGADSVVHARRLLTVPAAAAQLRRGLREGWLTADLLRVVREMRSNASHLDTESDRRAFFSAPSTTGDRRWDAMLAGVVEDLALEDGVEAPAWCRGRPLEEFWFVGSAPSLHAWAFARTPMSLQVRGVMVDPADLEAV